MGVAELNTQILEFNKSLTELSIHQASTAARLEALAEKVDTTADQVADIHAYIRDEAKTDKSWFRKAVWVLLLVVIGSGSVFGAKIASAFIEAPTVQTQIPQ